MPHTNKQSFLDRFYSLMGNAKLEIFPWQVLCSLRSLAERLSSISLLFLDRRTHKQVPLLKCWYDKLFNKESCQGKFASLLAYTGAN